MPKVNIVKTGTPTAEGSEITDAWVEYKGERVTEVPPGERFDIYAKGVCKNPGAFAWEVLITAFSSDGTIAAYDTTDAYGGTYTTPRMKIDSLPSGFQLPRMPNVDIFLNFRLWGNDKRGQDVPPISEW